MLWWSFRRPLHVALALAPLVLGVTWMLGIMSLAGIHMNVINVPVTAMILGIGIDDAVHCCRRIRGSHVRLVLERTLRKVESALPQRPVSCSLDYEESPQPS